LLFGNIGVLGGGFRFVLVGKEFGDGEGGKIECVGGEGKLCDGDEGEEG
jgi:hypothetical protein